jgi:hypothetical protein
MLTVAHLVKKNHSFVTESVFTRACLQWLFPSHTNPVHTIMSYFFKTHFNIIFIVITGKRAVFEPLPPLADSAILVYSVVN